MSCGAPRFHLQLRFGRPGTVSGCIERALEKKRRAIAAHRSQTTNLINDDWAGFRLTESDLARFDLPYEFFFESDA